MKITIISLSIFFLAFGYVQAGEVNPSGKISLSSIENYRFKKVESYKFERKFFPLNRSVLSVSTAMLKKQKQKRIAALSYSPTDTAVLRLYSAAEIPANHPFSQ